MEENKVASLVCPKCGEKVAVPIHCGREMHQEGDQLVCWMGPSCGSQPMLEHCGEYMEYKA
nr:MAG: hypothetical protein AM324_05225 [Candidatus Thorarchaeota archaeon SMTZ1-83]